MRAPKGARHSLRYLFFFFASCKILCHRRPIGSLDRVYESWQLPVVARLSNQATEMVRGYGCSRGDLNFVNDDDDGRLRSWRGLLLRHLHCVLSSPPTSQKTAAASDRASRWRTARGTQRDVRTSIHWDEITGDLRSNLPIPQPPTGAPPQRGVSAISSHASSSRSPTRPPEGVPAHAEKTNPLSWGK